MRAYSLDLRTHLLQAVDRGVSKAEAAQTFGVAVSTINRYRQRQRERGTLAPSPIPGRPRRIGPAQHAALEAQLATHPDATLEQHCQRWAADQGVVVSPATMSRTIARLGWTWKKSHWWPPSVTTRLVLPGVRR